MAAVGSGAAANGSEVRSLRIGPDRTGVVVEIENARIVRAGPPVPGAGGQRAPGAGAADAEHLPCPESLIAPGAVNAHTHMYSGLAPLGMPIPADAPRNFVEILERIWWRLDRSLDDATLHASARFYVTEALLAGTTTLIDHHESPSFIEGALDVLADVCQDLGIRAVLCFGATERNGGRDEARRGLAECRRFIQTNRRPLIRGVVGLHASFTVSDETIREAGDMCRKLGTILHVHLAEDVADVEDARHRGYQGPLQRLFALDALPPGSIVAHGVHLDGSEVREAAERGIWIVQNPRSNRGNRVGYPMQLRQSTTVALGTDGYPAQMAVEADILRQEASLRGDDPRAVERRIGAGHALVSALFGASFAPLAEGGAADVVVFEEEGAQNVVVDGRLVVKQRRLQSAACADILAEAREAAPRLWQRMREMGMDVRGPRRNTPERE